MEVSGVVTAAAGRIVGNKDEVCGAIIMAETSKILVRGTDA